MKVLVVDDDQSVRATLTELLKSFGHSVVEGTSAEEGLEILSREAVDFIISDWNMSGMSGVEFLSAVRSDPDHKDVPFIIVTSPGNDEIQKIEAAVESRVDAYVVKPFRGEILNSKITEILSKRNAMDLPRGGVLVVDDDEQARKVVVEIAETLGHKPVFEATNGDEAFELLEKHAGEITMVISDWEMPKLSGNKLLRKIREDQRFSKLPFIMITSQTSIEQMKLREAINAQVSHYLMKPFTIRDLESKINIVLSKANVESKTHQLLRDAYVAFQAGHTNESRTLYRDALKGDPKSIPALLGLAETYLQDGDAKSFDEAIALMEKAVHVAPMDEAPYISMALAYEKAKSLDRAIHNLQEGAKQVPASANIRFQLGRVCLRRGHKDQAIVYLDQALKMNPGLNEAAKLLAEAKKAKKSEDQA